MDKITEIPKPSPFTRRDVLKLLGIGGSAIGLGFLAKLYQGVFSDINTEMGCLVEKFDTFTNIQNSRELEGRFEFRFFIRRVITK